MRTSEPESNPVSPPIDDPYSPREPSLFGPPTPPPEIGSAFVQEDASTGQKEDGREPVLAVAAEPTSLAAMAAIRMWNPYMTPERDDGHTMHMDIPATCADPEQGGRPAGRDEDDDDDRLDGPALRRADTPSRSNTVRRVGVSCPEAGQSPMTSELPSHHRHHHDDAVLADSGADAPSTRRGHVSQANLPSPSTLPFQLSPQRLYPYYPSSFLRPGSKFSGTQQSDHTTYKVDVQILTLSTPESSLTGYLRICGLTEDHPTLTTFFTGEIIGGPFHKYGFQTNHQSWGATDLTDLQHWAQFPAWRQLSKATKEDIYFKYPPASSAQPKAGSKTGLSDYQHDSEANPGWWRKPNVFMRWKEWFLVPDHRVTTIPGASFEGFYYICFNQHDGHIHGIYFHGKSKRYQQLELRHQFDRGVFGAMEFR